VDDPVDHGKWRPRQGRTVTTTTCGMSMMPSTCATAARVAVKAARNGCIRSVVSAICDRLAFVQLRMSLPRSAVVSHASTDLILNVTPDTLRRCSAARLYR
jgi:hypothetical protein